MRPKLQFSFCALLFFSVFSFQEEYPPQLVTLQHEHWDPLFEWVQKEFGVPLEKYGAIMRPSQSDATRAVLAEVLNEMDALTLAG